jgi:lipopolysaccharide transport system ATP-binding protein
MSEIAIRAEGLSKRYRIEGGSSFKTLRERLSPRAMRVRKPAGRHQPGEIVWALQDVSFEVRRGQAVGVIGPNGAGKTTLLRILARITEPTYGRAEVRGRVGSMLDIGTGFHPELTGRENIYLNGAILGMRRAEIESRFDQILELAGVTPFLETPVKWYSSGMKLRLAFAVAAHLPTDILMVDEVLAVGDLVFQRRCLDQMERAAGAGRTVLFVSHNLGAVANLCRAALWLDQGRLRGAGQLDEVVRAYVRGDGGTRPQRRWRHSGNGEARIEEFEVLDAAGGSCSSFSMGETVAVEFTIQFARPFPSVELALEVKQADLGLPVLHLVNQDGGLLLQRVEPGLRRFRVELPGCPLYPTSYKISLWVGCQQTRLDYVTDIAEFTMAPSGISPRTAPFSLRQGVVHLSSQWREL